MMSHRENAVPVGLSILYYVADFPGNITHTRSKSQPFILASLGLPSIQQPTGQDRRQ